MNESMRSDAANVESKKLACQEKIAAALRIMKLPNIEKENPLAARLLIREMALYMRDALIDSWEPTPEEIAKKMLEIIGALDIESGPVKG